MKVIVKVHLNDSDGTASVPVDVSDVIAGYARSEHLQDKLDDDVADDGDE